MKITKPKLMNFVQTIGMEGFDEKEVRPTHYWRMVIQTPGGFDLCQPTDSCLYGWI